MNPNQIKLNGKTFVLSFGMKVLRLLSEKWKVPGINEVIQKMVVLESLTDNLTFEQIDVINDLVLCSIASNSDNTETITAEELDELYLNDMTNFVTQIEIVIKGFMASLPQFDAGKQKAAKKK